MKKNLLFTFLMLVFAVNLTWAQVTLPYYEAFDYPIGDSLPMHGWTGINGGDQILVVDSSLSYSGLANSVGRKVAFDASGRDFQLTITPQTSGTIYMSYILRIPSLGALNETGGYYTGFGASPTTFGATNWVKKNGSGFSLGVNAKSTVTYTVWDVAVLPLNTPILVVVSYEIVAGTINDIAKMWINPAPGTLGGGSAPTPTLTVTNGAADLSSVERIFLRQDYSTATPYINIDEIRVGTSWASVTPTSSGVSELTDINNFQINPNPSNGEFMIKFYPKTSYDVKIFNVLGTVVLEMTKISNVLPVNISNLDKGFYFVQLKDNNTTIVATKKVIVR
jgi:hypothetical protein